MRQEGRNGKRMQIFNNKNRYISETVEDRHRVTIVDCNSNVRTDFPRLIPMSVTLNHSERPQRTTAPYIASSRS